MKEQQSTDIVRISAIRAEQGTNLKFDGLDVAGVHVGGEIRDEIPEEHRTTAFAIAASLAATGQPLYYSRVNNAISTDATFAAAPTRHFNFKKSGSLPVVSMEGIWSFATNTGTLVLTFDDGPIETLDVNDPFAFIGWLHLNVVEELTFDGNTLATPELRTWELDDFLA
jgi:hypothetical protein